MKRVQGLGFRVYKGLGFRVRVPTLSPSHPLPAEDRAGGAFLPGGLVLLPGMSAGADPGDMEAAARARLLVLISENQTKDSRVTTHGVCSVYLLLWARDLKHTQGVPSDIPTLRKQPSVFAGQDLAATVRRLPCPRGHL